jgi:peptidoglycan/LPS O-acetylase OafA/YrhL
MAKKAAAKPTAPPPVKSSKHVDFLDHARGIAVLSVFIFHCFGTTFGADNLPWIGWIRSFAVQKVVVTPSFLALLPAIWGWAGVSIFFVISGFCIHMSFQQQGKQWGNFFIRRFFRIYPPYLASVVLCELFKHRAVLYGTDGVAQWLTHLLLIHNYGTATVWGINPVFWSIAVEVQLYLIYPILIALVSRFGWSGAILITVVLELQNRCSTAELSWLPLCFLRGARRFGKSTSWLTSHTAPGSRPPCHG